MKRILFAIFFLTVMFSCDNQQNNKTNSTNTDEKLRAQTSKCDKCEKNIIVEFGKTPPDSLQFQDIEEFLCLFDRGCKWSKKYPSPDQEIVVLDGDSILVQNGESTYLDMAKELLMTRFYYRFTDYMKILESKNDIDKRYLLSLMEYEEPMDLPFTQILDSLQHYQSDHPIKDSLIGVFEENVQRFGY